MSKILLVYAPKGGNVEKITKKFAELAGNENFELLLIEKIDEEFLKKFKSADKYIMVISTVGRSNWDSYYTKIGWDLLLPEMKNLDFTNKKVAIIGLGDHLLYPDNFVDSMSSLNNVLIEKNAKVYGQVNANEYDFDSSLALEKDFFVGLPIDEDNENELTNERLKKWITSIKSEFGL